MKRIAFIFYLCIFLVINTQQAFADDQIERISGANRFEVAVNLSKKAWPGGANTVVLAYYNAYADALAASPLAYKYDGPILLTESNRLTSVSKEEIKRLNPTNVIIVGGTASVTNRVENELKSMNINNVWRLGGKDRFEVAYHISRELGQTDTAIIAYGLNFPDALAIAPYAARAGFPILLTQKDQIPEATMRALREKNITKTTVVGGEGSVSNSVLKKLPGHYRIGGKDRFEVAANIIRQLNLSTDKTFLATGLTFADALTGSVVAAKENAPVLLTMPDRVPDSTRLIINEKQIKNFTVLGGLGSVQQKTVSQLSGPLGGLKLVLDAGHGGGDPGAVGNNLKEKEVVFDVVNRVQQKMVDAGATIILTRPTDSYVSLADRVKIANESGGHAFISVHTNSFTTSTPNGTETYWNSVYSSTESKELATEIHKELIKNLGTNDRGVKEAGFYVIKNTTMPSVLIEIAFISNPNDAKILADPIYREKTAEAIFQGVTTFYKKK